MFKKIDFLFIKENGKDRWSTKGSWKNITIGL